MVVRDQGRVARCWCVMQGCRVGHVLIRSVVGVVRHFLSSLLLLLAAGAAERLAAEAAADGSDRGKRALEKAGVAGA